MGAHSVFLFAFFAANQFPRCSVRRSIPQLIPIFVRAVSKDGSFVRTVYAIGVADIYSYDGPVYRKVVSTTNELATIK